MPPYYQLGWGQTLISPTNLDIFTTSYYIYQKQGIAPDARSVIRKPENRFLKDLFGHLKFYTYICVKYTCMTTKLTLTVEKNVIEKAKVYARNTGRSLSELIEAYLESIIQENKPKDKMSSKLKSLVGSVKLPKNFDEKKELDEYYRKKHL
jgi:hypothetical protein